jgi:hypothetical protein
MTAAMTRENQGKVVEEIMQQTAVVEKLEDAARERFNVPIGRLDAARQSSKHTAQSGRRAPFASKEKFDHSEQFNRLDG